MYDTATDSLWHQSSGEAKNGDFLGAQLQELPSEAWGVVRWGEWQKLHPDTLVLTCAHCEGRGEATGTIDELRDGNVSDFELVGLDGAVHRLSDYRGKVVLVNFWATWCLSCRDEFPILNDLHQKLADQGVVILGISTDREGKAKVQPYVDSLAIDYPILLDPEAASTSIFGGLAGYPSTFILDRQGLIYSSYLGAQKAETLLADLTYLLQATPSPGAALPAGAKSDE
jgi:thiol-disulfide isomerase/thioredoxin